MSATGIYELDKGQTASRDLQAIHFTREFRVDVNDETFGATTAMVAVGIPTLGSAHPSHVYASCRSLRAEQYDPNSKYAWRVTAEYSTPSGATESTSENPLDDIPQVAWTFDAYSAPIDKDMNGNAVRNSAGDRLDPMPEREFHVAKLSVLRNEPTYNPVVAYDLIDSINASTVTLAGYSVAARWAKLDELSGVWKRRHGTAYWEVSYVISISRDTWIRSIIDEGFYALDANGKSYRITDKNNVDKEVTTKLDGSGKILALGQPAQYLSFSVYKETDFSTLNLATVGTGTGSGSGS